MKPWEKLKETSAHIGADKITLSRRDSEFSLRADYREIMNSRSQFSQAALAEHVAKFIGRKKSPEVLLCNIGMGFVLDSLLQHLPGESRITLLEENPDIIDWNREFFSSGDSSSLDDSRLIVDKSPALSFIQSHTGYFDLIVVDCDLVPSAFYESSKSLIAPKGLTSLRAALKWNGVVAIWSSANNEDLYYDIKRAGLIVERREHYRREGKKGGKDTLWLCEKRSYQKK